MSKISSRYATALYESCKKTNQIEHALESLQALSDSLITNRKALVLLTSPLLTDQQKEEMIALAFGESLNSEIKNLMSILAKNNRLNEIHNILDSYKEIYSFDKGLVAGEVNSATELNEDEKTRITKAIEKKLASSVDLKFKVNPEMIGGIEARVGSYIFEDSIQSHMQKLNDFMMRRVQ